MTEYETVTRKLEELQVEMHNAQQEQQKVLDEMTDVNESIELDGVTVAVNIDYAGKAEQIFNISNGEATVALTTEQINKAVQFLAQFNVPINRYNEYLETEKEVTADEAGTEDSE